MKKISLVLLSFLIINSVKSQCTAPTFTVNLSAAADTSYILNKQTRGGVCCVGSSTVVSSSNCISFVVYLNPNTELISFDVTSPAPSGAAYYQVNCGPPVSIGTPLCAVGLISPFTITYCKPGGDSPDYLISAGTIVKGSNDISIQKTGCVDTLFVSNVQTSSIVWTSIYPGTQGLYNNYLSCTTGCNSTLVTPIGTPPPYVDFMVSGMPNTSCGSFSKDTVRVYFVPRITGTVTPASPVICNASGTSVTLTASISGGALPYKYDWANDPGPNNSQTSSVSSGGTYTVIVTDNTKCPSLKLTKTIATIPATTFSYSASQFCKNVSNPSPVFIGYGQAGVFSSFPAGISFVSTSTGEINLAASSSGTYVITNTISPSGTCPGSSSTTTISLYSFPIMSSASTVSICSEKSVNISLTSSIGSKYTWYAADNSSTTGESITTQTTTSLSNTISNSTNSVQVVSYTVTPTSTVSGECIGTPQTISVTVNPKDDAGFTYPSSTFCESGTNPVATITGLSGGTFSSTAGLTINNTTGAINLATSTSTLHVVTYSTSGTCPNTSTLSIRITAAPSGVFSYAGTPFCSNQTNPLPVFGANASGGSFSIPSSTLASTFLDNLTGEINLAGIAAGTYTITNTIIPTSSLCATSTASTVVTITKLKVATFSYSASPYCENASNPVPTFIGGGVAGTFSSSPTLSITPANGIIAIANSGVGTYTITNTIAATSGCAAVTASASVTITKLPVATFNYSTTPFCKTGSNPLPTFTGSGTAGAFSSSSVYLDINSSTGLINLSNSVADNYIVVNTISAANGCPAVVASSSITITGLPIGTFVYSGLPYCSDGANPTPTLSVGGTNGVYTFTPSGLSLEPNSGTINLLTSTAGSYTITNTIAAANGCPNVLSTYPVTVTPTPAANAGATKTLTCLNSTVTLSGSGSATYLWTGPGIGSGSNTATPSVNTPGTYSLVVTSSLGCSSKTSTVAISQNTTAPVTAASTSGSITCVTNTVSLSSSLSGMSYTWTAPAGSSVISGSTLQNAIGQGLGTYTINVLNTVNNCTYSTTIAANQNLFNPTDVSAGSDQTIVCGIPTVTLSASATPTNSSVNWIGGICGSTSEFTTTACAPGTYTIEVSHPVSGCIVSSTVAVLSSTDVPQASVNAVTNSITCINSEVTIGITLSNSDPVIYSWSGPGISGSLTDAITTATVAGTYSVIITNSITNCESSYNTVVSINTTPVTVNITPASTITCSNPSITLNASPTGSQYSYSWNGPSISSGGNTTNPIVDLEGDYDVLVTNTITGCTGTASLTVSSNTILPIVMISAPSVTINCANLTALLYITSTPTTDVSYSWIAPVTGSLDFYTISNPIASGSGIFTVVVTNTISGCSSSSISQNTIEVISDLVIPTTTLSISSLSITCSNPTPSVNISTSISSVTYSWSPANGIVAGTETTANPSFSLAGTYSVIVTNTISGCETFIDNNIVTVDLDNTIPVISISSSVNDGTITCLTSSISVTPTISPNNDLTYLWTSNGSGISGPADQASATFTASGAYTLAITNTITGCSSVLDASSTFSVYVDTILPTLVISVPSHTTTCANPTASLNIASTPTNNVTYSWIAPVTGSLDFYTVSNPIASGSGIFTVVVTNTVSGCSSSSITQSTIEVIPDNGIPTTTLSSTSLSITCANQTPSVNIGTNASSATYSWSPVNGIVAGTETTANPSFNLAGSYSVVVTNTISGCESFINNNVVTVDLNNTIPVIAISSSVNDGTLTCSTTSISVTPTISPNNDLAYLWTNGAGISGPVDQASATFTAAGIYTLAITNTVTGCTSTLDASSTFTVFVDVTSPVSNFNFATSCSNDSVRFTDHSSVSSGSITNWNWSFGDTKTSILQNSANAYSTINSYTVTLQVQSSNGCVNSSSQVVNLSETVIADYMSHGGSYNVNQEISFTNQSLGASSYIWNFGDGSSTDLTTNPSHIFTSLGIYTATLIASNGIGCVDTVAYIFEIKPSGYAIPGGFTPNNDGINDGFSVLGGPFSVYELKVFNAWGNEVFFSNSQAEKWDGTYKEAQQPAGTYIYIFNGKIEDGEELKLKGEVHIIR